MGTIEEKLNELLDQKKAEVGELQERVWELENELEKSWDWAAHKSFDKDPYDLPVPRLQIVAEPNRRGDWYDEVWTYSLVHKHLTGIIVCVPLGQTKRSGGRNEKPDVNDLPFRDGAHIKHECFTLSLPAFSIVEDEVVALEPYEPKP